MKVCWDDMSVELMSYDPCLLCQVADDGTII